MMTEPFFRATVVLIRRTEPGTILAGAPGMRGGILRVLRTVKGEHGERIAICDLTGSGKLALRRGYPWRPKQGMPVYVVRGWRVPPVGSPNSVGSD